MSASTFLVVVLLFIVFVNHSEAPLTSTHHHNNIETDVQANDLAAPRPLQSGPVKHRVSLKEAAHLLEGVHNLLDLSQHRLFIRTTNDSFVRSDDSLQYGHESRDNCTNPRNPPQEYRDSCHFVRAECAKKAELIDYTAFVVCALPSVQVSISCTNTELYVH